MIIDRHYRPLLNPMRRTRARRGAYRPVFPEQIDLQKLIRDVEELLGLSCSDVESKLAQYQSFHESQGYAQRLGEFKTLCFEEAFVVYSLLEKVRPKTIVEVGTQSGKLNAPPVGHETAAGLGEPRYLH